MFRRLLCLSVLGGLVTAFGVFAGAAGGSAATGPSGQVMYGGATFDPVSGHFVGGGGTIEPAYDDATEQRDGSSQRSQHGADISAHVPDELGDRSGQPELRAPAG